MTNYEQAYEMYLTFSKEELARMLAIRDICSQTTPNFKKWTTNDFKRCQTWFDCTNPHYDCINCPLRY